MGGGGNLTLIPSGGNHKLLPGSHNPEETQINISDQSLWSSKSVLHCSVQECRLKKHTLHRILAKEQWKATKLYSTLLSTFKATLRAIPNAETTISDTKTRVLDIKTGASEAKTTASDAETTATDAEKMASDAETMASDAEITASDAETTPLDAESSIA